ncbi:MAG: hypothetical protein ABL925_08885 [Methylococcales bacterium]
MKQSRFWLPVCLGLIVVSASFYTAYSKRSTANKAVVETKLKVNTAAVLPPAAVPKNLSSTLSVPKDHAEKQTPAVQELNFAQLQALPTPVIWQHWTIALRQTNPDSTLATAALIEKLRQGGHAAKAVYKESAALLKDPSLSAAQRAELVNLLGEASTPDALAVLAKILQESNDDTLRYAVAEAIARGSSGLSAWELKPHPELSPILETLWQQLEQDAHLANALATRIVREGAPSGVKLILEQLGQDGKTAAEIAQSNNPRGLAALQAMQEIRNPQSLPLLKNTFQSQALDSAAFNATGSALSAMGSVEATKILLDWTRQAPDVAADQAQQWLGAAAGNDPDSAQFLKKALLENDSFQSAQVKQAILAVMKERD